VYISIADGFCYVNDSFITGKISIALTAVICLKVHTADGVVEADAIVAAVNSKIISRLLQDDHPLLSEKLNSLPIHDVATATLEYSTDAASSIPQVSFFSYCIYPCC